MRNSLYPIDWTANQYIGNQSEQHGHEQCFKWVEPVEDYNLVDEIQNQCDDENLRN